VCYSTGGFVLPVEQTRELLFQSIPFLLRNTAGLRFLSSEMGLCSEGWPKETSWLLPGLVFTSSVVPWSHVSRVNAPGVVARLGLFSRVLKKLIFTIFASVLIAFMERPVFRGPYSIVLEVAHFTLDIG